MKRLSSTTMAILMACTLSAQTQADPDSSGTAPQFTISEAWNYVDHAVRTDELWKSQKEPVRYALQRLLDHSVEPFDSIRSRLNSEDFSTVAVKTGQPVVSDTNEVKWLNDSTFLVDPHGWSATLYLRKETRVIYPSDTAGLIIHPAGSDSGVNPAAPVLSEAPQIIPDTVVITIIDTSAIAALGITMHSFAGGRISPSLDREGLTGLMSADRKWIYYYLPGTVWQASGDSPFRILEGELQLDSLQYAVNELLDFTRKRDSSLIWVNDMLGNRMPFWLTQGSDESYRYWVKNLNNDSITIWIGNPSQGEISLMLENDVDINRMEKEEVNFLPEFVEIPDRSLVPMKQMDAEPIYWDHSLSGVLTINQTYLTNWTKGGESSYSSMVDLLGEATYNNKEARTQWINTVRINFGTLSTKGNGFRKNNDLFEINSKFNGNAWGKIGMSASFYMKNQLAKGYNYPNDSVVVSKFLNPGSITVGLGFEYKPFKNTIFNLAPLSYKNTFVLDTAMIDQTKHGIEANKRAKQEMGAQLVFNNKVSPFKDLTVDNRLRLFSSYLNKPQNVDVDWEMILDQKINWFFTIRLNLHLIYDDDVRFTVLDSEGLPVLLPDGSEKKVAKTQFKEFIGLSLQFKF